MSLKILRPNNLNEFIGNKNIKTNISIFIKASKIKNTFLDHCLFYGLPGTGKTSLAFLIAKEFNKNIKIAQGNNFVKNNDVYNFILDIKEGDILFIDEIHAMNPICYELFYSILEDFSFDITIGKDFNSKTTRIKLPKFTLLAATTSLTKIPKPMLERFPIVFKFNEYSSDEIKIILSNACKKNKFVLENDEISQIAKYSKGIPRKALNILTRVMDFKTINQNIKISQILKKLGYKKNGLDENDLLYLNCFKQKKKLGIKTISQIIQLDIEFIEQNIEPYLVKNEYIQKTSNGREILQKGLTEIKNE